MSDLRKEESLVIGYRPNPRGFEPTPLRRVPTKPVRGHAWKAGKEWVEYARSHGFRSYLYPGGRFANHGCVCGVQHPPAEHDHAARNRHREHLESL